MEKDNILTGKAFDDFMAFHCKSDMDYETFHYKRDRYKCVDYMEWFDSIGITIYVTPYFNHDLGIMNEWAGYDNKGIITETFKTRKQATIEACREVGKRYNKYG